MKRLLLIISLALLTVFCSHGFCYSSGAEDVLSRTSGCWQKAFGKRVGGKITSSLKLISKASKPSLDSERIHSAVKDGSLESSAYIYLDDAMTCEKLLDQSDRIAAEIEKSVKDTSLQEKYLKPRAELSRFLRCRMRIIIGISRASIAQKMANPEFRAYCSQAMESSVDALRDAIKLSGDNYPRLGAPNPSASAVTELRSQLLAIWDRGQKAASVEPVKEMQLEKMVETVLWEH